jgi:hypothetical protein
LGGATAEVMCQALAVSTHFACNCSIDWSIDYNNYNNNNLEPLLSHTGDIHNVAPREAPWCHGLDSNLWPHGLKADALPLELSGQTLLHL